MLKPSTIVPFAVAALAVAAPSMGADEVVGAIPTPAQGVATAVTALVVFAISAVFLQLVVWPKISKGLADREHKIRSAIQEAELARQQAKTSLEQYQRDLAEARARAQADLEAARAQQGAIAAETRAKAERDVAMMKDKAVREIEAAKKVAISEVYAVAGQVASSMASRVLKREVNVQDEHRLLQEALSELKGDGTLASTH
jgi:F-type H+-transporting ATPase subunit b